MLEQTDKRISCCFTGHRSAKLPWRSDERDHRCLRLKRELADVLSSVYAAGYRRFFCGMALGCDMYFGEAVAALREERPDVLLEAAIPYERQSDGWSTADRRRYDRLAAACDRTHVLHSGYTADCMMDRNRFMVDNSSLLIAAYNGSGGGTRNTMLYAIRSGVRILELTVER